MPGYAERTFNKGWKMNPTGNKTKTGFLPEQLGVAWSTNKFATYKVDLRILQDGIFKQNRNLTDFLYGVLSYQSFITFQPDSFTEILSHTGSFLPSQDNKILGSLQQQKEERLQQGKFGAILDREE